MDTEETFDVSAEEETSVMEPSTDVDTDEPSMEEELPEEETSLEETSEEKVYADKYRSVEALEEGYKHTTSENSRLAQELSALRKELKESNMSPEEKKYQSESLDFVKKNGLVTKQDLKDERDAGMLLAKGARQTQIDHVMDISSLPRYANMSIPQIFKDVYGGLPRAKPKQGVKAKSTRRSVTPRTISRREFNSMDFSSAEYKKIEGQLLSGYMKLVD